MTMISQTGSAATLGAADCLGLAAAPVFALMAALTAYAGNGPVDAICATVFGTSAFGGMTPMYLLMSAFHLAPWLRMISRR